MDRDFEQNIKDLERGYELKQEEDMHGERIGQTLEMNEELEDKLDLVKKLKKQWLMKKQMMKMMKRKKRVKRVKRVKRTKNMKKQCRQDHPKEMLQDRQQGFCQSIQLF